MAKEDLPAEFPLMPVDNVFYHLEMPVSNPTPS
jgi:hypothetical protein